MFDNWNNVHGVSMQCFARHFRETIATIPDIHMIEPNNILSEPKTIFWIDLNDVTPEELDTVFTQEIFSARRKGLYQGVALWFSCQFPNKVNKKERVVLSTGPKNEPTHWKQTVIVLPTETIVEEGEPIAFELIIKRSNQDRRRYTIEFTMMDPEKVTHPEPCDCHMTKCIIIKKMLEQYEQQDCMNGDEKETC